MFVCKFKMTRNAAICKSSSICAKMLALTAKAGGCNAERAISHVVWCAHFVYNQTANLAADFNISQRESSTKSPARNERLSYHPQQNRKQDTATLNNQTTSPVGRLVSKSSTKSNSPPPHPQFAKWHTTNKYATIASKLDGKTWPALVTYPHPSLYGRHNKICILAKLRAFGKLADYRGTNIKYLLANFAHDCTADFDVCVKGA